MSKVDINNIMDEMLWYLRNKVTDPSSRGSTQTDEFNGNGSTKVFTLTKTPVQNVTTVTVDGGSQTYGTHYSVSINLTTRVGTITFVTAPGSGTNNVDVTYHYGQTWIFPDTPRADLRLSSFPRMALTVVTGTTDLIGLNADGFMTSLLLGVTAYAADDDTVRDLLRQAKDNIMDDAKTFYYFNLVKPVGLSALIPYTEGKTEIVQQTMDLEIPFIFEN